MDALSSWIQTLVEGDWLGRGNSLVALVGAVSCAVLLLAVVAGLGRFGRRRLSDLSLRSRRRPFFVGLGSLRLFPALLVAAGIPSLWLDLSPQWATRLRLAALVGFAIQLALLATHLLSWLIEAETERRRTRNQEGLAVLGLAQLLGQVIIWSAILLVVLTNLGLDVSGLVASLGVGGIAVALAAQNILVDLFASLSIILDRPFEVGDFIVVGDEVGTVSHIGLKSTRIKALSGEQIVVGNANLLSSRVRNFKRMARRRVVLRFGVFNSADRETITRIPVRARQAVEKQAPRATFDRAHVDGFGASSVDFEVVYFVESSDFVNHMDVKEAILMDLFDIVEDEGLAFAYPTMALHVKSLPEPSPTARAS